MRYSDSVVELIGNTPLVRLHHVVPEGPTVLAKVEYFNPGGSVKDRIAVRMIDAAEESGELKPGGTIVEPTSGNTGVGLAIAAQARGQHIAADLIYERFPEVTKRYVLAVLSVLAAAVCLGFAWFGWGEAVHAVVVPRADVDAEALIAHCRALIAGYKVPKRIVLRDEPLPKSGAGKVLKRELRDEFWKESSRQV